MRLIDADALIPNEVHTIFRMTDKGEQIVSVIYAEDIDNASTIEVEPIRHGKWEEYLSKGLRWKCSLCENRFVAPYTYCPHCGARMEGVDE